MTIAELFVNLGVKGDGKALKATKNIDKSMKEIKKSSLAAKAAIAAVVYGMYRLLSGAGKMGQNLASFEAFTGVSTAALQKWQLVLKDVGVASEATQGAITGVAQAMAGIHSGNAPAGLVDLIQFTKLDTSRLHDIPYVFEKIRELSKNTVIPIGKLNEILGSFGLSPEVIAGLRQSTKSISDISDSRILSDKQIENLQKVKIGFDKLGDSISKAMDKLAGKYGAQFIKDMNILIPKILDLTKALIDLGNSMKVFEHLTTVITNIANALGFLSGGISDTMSGKAQQARDQNRRNMNLEGENELRAIRSRLLGGRELMERTVGQQQVNNTVNVNVQGRVDQETVKQIGSAAERGSTIGIKKVTSGINKGSN